VQPTLTHEARNVVTHLDKHVMTADSKATISETIKQ
jgi:hypothetical protein